MIYGVAEYYRPTTVSEALALLSEARDDSKLLAGGQSLIPMMKLELAIPRRLVDLGKIADLSGIRETEDGLVIGAMTRYDDVEHSSLVADRFPLLVQTVREVADVQVRNRGTIGGSLAHADPAADTPAAMLALDAELTILGPRGARRLLMQQFVKEAYETDLRPDEILSEIFIPELPPATGTSYKKFANKASHFAIVGIAAVVTLAPDGVCRHIAIGITGAGSRPTRASEAERFLLGKRIDASVLAQAAELTTNGIEFSGDLQGSADYPKQLTKVCTERALKAALGERGAGVPSH